MSLDALLQERAHALGALGAAGPEVSLEATGQAIQLLPRFFRDVMLASGYPERSIRALTTKFRDAGRRSAPWKPASSKVPGRPQDGADGNRLTRWLFEHTHKYYADERTATLVEIKYYLQALSMTGAPDLEGLLDPWQWLTGYPIRPDTYRDPIQLTQISLVDVLETPRIIHSGHLMPLDRGGKHEPSNAFLTLARSNQLQGNMTLDELLNVMNQIILRHDEARPEWRQAESKLPPGQILKEAGFDLDH